MSADDPFRAETGVVLDDLRSAAAFLTRIPEAWIGSTTAARPDFRRAARTFPLIGAVIGLVGGLVLVVTMALGEPAFIAAALAVAAAMFLTGGLHEDGLADTADGFGGGATAERKLEIMDDSRIGTFGAAALVFSILLRIGTLAALAAVAPWYAALTLVAAESVSRAAMVRLWHELPPAKLDGLSHETGAPDQPAMLVALALAAIVVVLCVIPTVGLAAAIAGVVLTIAVTYAFTRLAARAIGGRTGDTLGACQQIAAVAFLIGVAAFA